MEIFSWIVIILFFTLALNAGLIIRKNNKIEISSFSPLSINTWIDGIERYDKVLELIKQEKIK